MCKCTGHEGTRGPQGPPGTKVSHHIIYDCILSDTIQSGQFRFNTQCKMTLSLNCKLLNCLLPLNRALMDGMDILDFLEKKEEWYVTLNLLQKKNISFLSPYWTYSSFLFIDISYWNHCGIAGGERARRSERNSRASRLSWEKRAKGSSGSPQYIIHITNKIIKQAHIWF